MVWDVALGIVLGFVLLALLPFAIQILVTAMKSIFSLLAGIFEFIKTIAISLLWVLAVVAVFLGGFKLTGLAGFSEPYQLVGGLLALPIALFVYGFIGGFKEREKPKKVEENFSAGEKRKGVKKGQVSS
jgi:NADH:ubiquinone oxidoreductase subunit H